MVDDDIDDIDLGADDHGPSAPKAPSSKPSLKEVWETNPTFKVAAVALSIVVLVGGLMIFSGGEEEQVKSMLRVGDTSNVKQVPGQSELDPSYRKALEDVNKKEAEQAAQSGGSALPTPIGPAKTSGLDTEMPEMPKVDPLAEWRKATEARRQEVEKQEVEQETPPPEVVPLVQPIRPEPVAPQRDPNMAKLLVEQMRVILGAQEPTNARTTTLTQRYSEFAARENSFVTGTGGSKTLNAGASYNATSPTAPKGNGTDSATGPTTAPAKKVRPIVSAGTLAYAQTLNALNSDIQGPVMAMVLSGPFSGGRALGSIEIKDEYMVITFSMIVKDAVSYKINAIAIDEKTTLAGQASDVDHHYFARIILPAAAKFVEGYGSAISQVATSSTATSGVGSTTSSPTATKRQAMARGISDASSSVGKVMDEAAKRPITVKINAGTTMGILFIDTVTTGDAGI